ncbi:MAG TPA: molybdate ABC transporter substrate-binding protein [Gaiellaceae bacterium]|nr:molybdate ABC transporter substrate-binding protein [Gaiellaceae bacterium]
MRVRALAAALAAAVLVASSALAAVAFAGSHRSRPQLTVFAAASLTDVFPKIDPHGRYSFGGSNMLAAQIQQGLPADVFASANVGLPWQLHRKGLVTRPVVFTSNKLVIVLGHGNPRQIRSVQGLEKPGLRIVMAAAGVPVGDYTRKVLERLGLSDLVDKAVSQETDVREVLAKVVLGEADAGFVYATDARTVQGKVSLLGIPKSAQPQVLYAAAAVKSGRHLEAARTWIKRLLRRPAQRKLRAAGFLRIPR